MLPIGANASDLAPFCVALEEIMERDEEDLVRVVPVFQAFNKGAHPAFAIPTDRQWGEALRETFGVLHFPGAGARLLLRRQDQLRMK